MKTEADENYLKEIYSLQMEQSPVSTSTLAQRFGYSSATITGMLKKLASLDWVVYKPYYGVTLTETGAAIALEVIRRHRLIETFLVQALDIPWDRVHQEAERLEHSLSAYLEEKIDAYLGYPTFDPHGSPIPTTAGLVESLSHSTLGSLPQGIVCEIVEVNDRDPRVLAYLDQLKLGLKSVLEILHVEPIDGLVTILVDKKKVTLGPAIANQIFVRIINAS